MIQPFGNPEEPTNESAYFKVHAFPQGNDIFDLIIETEDEYYEKTVFSSANLGVFMTKLAKELNYR